MKEVYFDTNFLLRFYLDDIPKQASNAKKMVNAAKSGRISLITDLIVVCEMVWVLDSYYGLRKNEILEKISNLYHTPGITIMNGDILPQALNMYVDKNIDFTDAIIAASALRNRIEYLASFDKKYMGRFKEYGLKRIESPEDVA